MRIRSIRPEFWTSEDIAALPWETRLLFIGLWSYVDDNGVGRDIEKLIVADLFPLEEDIRDTLASVQRGLAHLFTASLITRYTVDGKRYLHINTWEKHQKIDRPGAARYPLPTCGDAVIRETLASPHRALDAGEGEKGRRGEGEKGLQARPAKPDMSEPDPWLFTEFWEKYPRKVRKEEARKAWAQMVKKADPDKILAGVHRMSVDPNLPDEQFIPHASRWLRASGWDDPPYPDRTERRPRRMATTDAKVLDGMSLVGLLAAQEQAAELPQITRGA